MALSATTMDSLNKIGVSVKMTPHTSVDGTRIIEGTMVRVDGISYIPNDFLFPTQDSAEQWLERITPEWVEFAATRQARR